MSNSSVILSYDIGIKNLGYCLLEIEKDENNKPILKQIIKWGIINTVSPPPPPPSCEWSGFTISSKKTGSIRTKCNCDKQACFIKNNINYCKKHTDKTCIINAIDFSKIKKKNINDLRIFCETKKITTDFSLKKAELVENIEKQIKNDFYIPITAIKNKTASEIDLISIGREMTRQLDLLLLSYKENEEPLLNKITHIYIENQISTIAIRMKSIQGMLTQYFIMREKRETPLCIKYISSSVKLKEEQHRTGQKHTTYTERKKMSIGLCEKILEESKNKDVIKWIDFFKNYGIKRDDLADSFLQGLYG